MSLPINSRITDQRDVAPTLQAAKSAPDSRRYSALGDAVTASVAEWIGRRLAAA